MKQQTPALNRNTVFHALDLAKFICALLVVLIHTPPLGPYSAVANFYSRDVLSRLAVPLFFAISGFLFARKPAPVKTFKRIGTLYLGWSAFYLLIQVPQWYNTGWWGFHVIVDYVWGLMTKGTYFHLWYLLATLFAIPCLHLLVKRNDSRLMLGVCCICWLAECMTYSYSWICLDRITWLAAALDRFSGVCDGLFRALPLMLIGVFCYQNASTHSAGYWGKRALVAFFVLTAEASVLYFATPNSGRYSYLFATPFFTYYFLCFLLSCNFRFRRGEYAVILRRASLMIYCIHPFVGYFVKQTAVPAGIPQWLTVTAISAGFSLAYSMLCLRHSAERRN